MSRYAISHKEPQGPGDSRPTALQIVSDNDMEGKLVGKVAVVTGVSSGIGIETVRALAATGITLLLTARDLVKAKNALDEIWQEDRMQLIEMDQASLRSVRTAAGKILEKTDKVNILVTNAGVMALPTLNLTEDGYECQFATNHLSHFLLFQLLKNAMLKATTPGFQSRVVVVSAAAHRIGRIPPAGDYSFQKSDYDPFIAYARSKTANIYLANEIERRYGSAGLHATSVHPGVIDTGLKKYLPSEMVSNMRVAYATTAKSSAQGAATTVWAAIGNDWEGRGGIYLSDLAEAQPGEDDGDWSKTTTASHTYDEKEEARLWKDSLKMVGLPESN